MTEEKESLMFTVLDPKKYKCKKCGYVASEIGVYLNPKFLDDKGNHIEEKYKELGIPKEGIKYCYKCWLKSFEGLGVLEEIDEN